MGRNTVLLIIFIISCVNVYADESDITNRVIKFTVESDSVFAIQANADGVLNVKNKNVTVDLSNIILNHNPVYKYTYQIISYDLCVVESNNKEGSWDLHKCSLKPYSINTYISPGQTVILPDHSFSIRYVPKLEGKWLVLLINGTSGRFFSHSEKGIFQPGFEPKH